MKKVSLLVMLLCTIAMYSQKEKNGTIYKEHPAITAVEAMQAAFIKGDTATVSSYLADNFRAFSGFTTNPDDQGQSKANFLNQSDWWSKNIKYLSESRSSGAYPDALEYKDDGVWVQTWDRLSGMDNETGVMVDMPVHRLYVLNKDNKITRLIRYFDNAMGETIREARFPRTNGTIYNSHSNINTVRKMMGALAHGDVDTGFGYFTDDARFTNLDMEPGKSNSLADEKKHFSAMLKDWDIVSLDVVGYPDYLEYEKDRAKTVLSWWNFRVKRKSDGKEVSIPIHLVNYFNDDGKMVREIGYYTTAAMMK